MTRSTFGIAFAVFVTSLAGVQGSSRQAAAPSATPAQGQQPVFTTSTNLVDVQVVVTDKRGRVVRGLSRDDFEITEDGRPQEVAAFSAVDVPLASGEALRRGAPATDVATNVLPSERRVYVLVLDAFHVDASRTGLVRRLARQFIESYVTPTDAAAVVLIGNAGASQSFTSDKALLTSAVDQFVGQKSRSAVLNTIDDQSLRRQTGGKGTEQMAEDAEAGSRASQARIMLASLRQVCDSLGATRMDRRPLVLFSEGIDMDTSDLIGEDKRPSARGGMTRSLMGEPARYAAEILYEWKAMLDSARRANVAISTIEPRGNTMGNEDIMQARIETDSRGQQIAPATAAMMAEAQRGQGSLRTFSHETGGYSIVGTDRFDEGFTRIREANSTYYVLGYRPQAAGESGAYHAIGVRVKARDDVEVYARRGYYTSVPRSTSEAPSATSPAAGLPGGMSAEMRDLLASPLPMRAGLDLTAAAGPIRAQGDKALVALVVEIDTRALVFKEQNGMLTNDVEVGFVAVGPAGSKPVGNRSLGQLRLPPADRAALTRGLRYVVEVPLAAGRYHVRAAVHETAGGTGGSALLDIDVPAFNNVELTLGMPLLTSRASQAMPTTGAFPIIKSALPAPPTTTRAFVSADTLSVLVPVLGSDTAKGTTRLLTTVRDASGTEVFRTEANLEPGTRVSGGGYAPVVQVPLTSFAAGTYEMAFEAKSHAGRTATRTITFQIH